MASAPAAAPAVAMPVSKIPSAEPSSFEAVSRRLDSGGGFYLYLSTEQFFKEVSTKLQELAPLAMSSLKIDAPTRAKIEAIWNSVSRVTGESGLNAISGFGMSSIATAPNFYQTKWMLHHYAGKGGFLWDIYGSVADAHDIISYLPETTAFAGCGDATLEPIWKALERESATNPDLKQALQMAMQQLQQSAGLDLAKLIAVLGPSYSVVLTLDESRKVTLPTDQTGKMITIPEPALTIMIQVRDEALIARLNQELTKVPGIVNSDNGDLKLRVIPVPIPMAFVRPAVAWNKGLVFISSNEAAIRDLIAVKSGKKVGIAASAEFKKLTAGLPTTVCEFDLCTPVFQKTLRDLRVVITENQAGLDPSAKQIMQALYQAAGGTDQWMCSVVENTSEGFVGTIRSGLGAMQITAAAGIAPVAALSAIAVPNFMRARKRSQASRVLEDLRMLDAALDQYAIEHNKRAGDPAAFSDLQAYLKTGTELYRSNNKDSFGNAYNNGEGYKVDSVPKVNRATFESLGDVAPSEFWSPFK